MKRVLLAVAVATACSSAAFAKTYPTGYPASAPAPIYVYPQPPAGLSRDEVLDYRRDQLDRRQEMERANLEMRHKAERRALDAYDDD